MNRNHVLLGALLLVVLTAGFWMIRQAPDVNVEADATPPSSETKLEQSLPSTDEPEVPTDGGSNGIERATVATERLQFCEKGRIRRDHPLVTAESERIAPILTDIPELDAYRGQSRNSLELLSQSGDALAMYVLGMSYLHEVAESESDDPVDFARRFAGSVGNGELSSAQIDLVDQGSHWLYESALHGRLQALVQLDLLEGSRYGGPIQQGLIPRDPDLSEIEQSALDTKMRFYINSELTIRSHPAFDTGFYGALRRSYRAVGLSPEERKRLEEDPTIQSIIDEKLATFERDRNQAGLALPVIPDPVMSAAQMYREICGDNVELPQGWQ